MTALGDHAALRLLPETAYEVTEVHVRRVGKDALLTFGGSHSSVPARLIRAGQRVEVRGVGGRRVALGRPSDGHLRATTTIVADLEVARDRRRHRPDGPPAHVARGLAIEVYVRPLDEDATAARMQGRR